MPVTFTQYLTSSMGSVSFSIPMNEYMEASCDPPIDVLNAVDKAIRNPVLGQFLYNMLWQTCFDERLRYNSNEILHLAQSVPEEVWRAAGPILEEIYVHFSNHVVDTMRDNVHRAYTLTLRGTGFVSKEISDTRRARVLGSCVQTQEVTQEVESNLTRTTIRKARSF